MSGMNGMPKTWRSNLVWGALWGMIAWQVYGVVEYGATTLAPLVVYRPMVIAAWHWKLSLLLFGFYTLAGILTGGFAAVLFTALKRDESKKSQLKTIGTLTLALAFLANLIVGAPEPATLMFSAIVVALLIWSLSHGSTTKRSPDTRCCCAASAVSLLQGHSSVCQGWEFGLRCGTSGLLRWGNR
jgi:hypothetical protein